jgi:hypothetical protein
MISGNHHVHLRREFQNLEREFPEESGVFAVVSVVASLLNLARELRR